jgi:hypothetical protein
MSISSAGRVAGPDLADPVRDHQRAHDQRGASPLANRAAPITYAIRSTRRAPGHTSHSSKAAAGMAGRGARREAASAYVAARSPCRLLTIGDTTRTSQW